ncbi:MAG: sodium:solute symporter [Bacteroidetes bacterium]|nr:sodium:solute symporter [Bacteroidota bacterium]MDA1125383.1 sodium:solute symporter [Bacteroidota bacterium]
MGIIDYSIIIVYLLILIGIGIYLQKRASKSTESFFLGDKNMPWWALGASGMASNLDVSGTMIIAALIYALGVQGFFIEIRGGVVLILAFFMIFMGKWNRRAEVMTTAEWMEFRFGKGKQGEAARVLAAIAQLIFAIWAITYFIQGAGIFLSEILGISPDLAAILMISLCAFYAALSGLYGVVYTEVFQGGLILFVIIYVVSHVMINITLPETFVVSVPMGDGQFQQITQNLKDWSSFLPRWEMNVPGEYSQYNLIGLATIMYIFRSSIDGMSGSGGYMIQRFYAAKNEREVGLLSVFWIFLLSFRWPFIMSIAILGISFSQTGQVIDNPETVLPKVLMEVFPVGIKGLLVAGLLAAAMSTYVAIVNSGAAYWVNDLYQRFIRPEATNKQLILHSRVASIAIVVLGLLSTYLFTSLNDVWGFLTMGFGVGLIVPQFIRWYWWRFNGYGYAGGTILGMITAITIRFVIEDIPEMPSFYLTAAITFVGSIAISYMFPPTNSEDLEHFYSKTRPFGFWGPVRAKFSDEIIAPIAAENRRDIMATFFAVPWMLFLGITPMMVVTKQWTYALICGSILLVLSVVLYFIWYKHLSKSVKVR